MSQYFDFVDLKFNKEYLLMKRPRTLFKVQAHSLQVTYMNAVWSTVSQDLKPEKRNWTPPPPFMIDGCRKIEIQPQNRAEMTEQFVTVNK